MSEETASTSSVPVSAKSEDSKRISSEDDVNPFRKIRRQELKLRYNKRKELLDERNRRNDRKILSSTFTSQNRSTDAPIGVSYFPPNRSNPLFQEKYFYLGSNRSYSADESKGNRNLSHRFDTFFVPSLVDQCCLTIAQNFKDLCSEFYALNEEKKCFPPEVVERVESKLSETLPLQVTVPYVTSEEYWRRCCRMRWSDGQIGRTMHQKEFSTYKRMYVERNLELFLEHIQSDLSLIREIQVLSNLQDSGEITTEHRSASSGIPINTRLLNQYRKESERVRILREAERVKREMFTRKGRKDMTDLMEAAKKRELEKTEVEEVKTLDEFHTHKMTPNLNYYLLHDENAKLPHDKYTKKLRDLFDGNESQSRSRLHAVSRNDDLFTFYENTIHRHEYKIPKRRGIDDMVDSPTSGYKNLRFWLLNKVPELDLLHKTPLKKKKKEETRVSKDLLEEFEEEDLDEEEEEEEGEDDLEEEGEDYGVQDWSKDGSKKKGGEEEEFDEFGSSDDISSASEYESDYEYDMEKQTMVKVRRKLVKTSSKKKRTGEKFTIPVIFPNDSEKQQLLYYVKKKTLKTLVGLCKLCRSTIESLRVTAMPSHLDVNKYLARTLPDLRILDLTYGVKNVGMSYNIDMYRANKQDMVSIAKSLYDQELRRREEEEVEEDSYAQYQKNKLKQLKEKRMRKKRRLQRRIRRKIRNGEIDGLERDKAILEQLEAEDESGKKKEKTYFFRSIEGLILRENLIEDNLLKILVSGLIRNRTLKKLDLSKNKISVQGAIYISAFVKKTKSLEILNISDNHIQTQGALYLASGIRNNESLRVLNVKFNRIKDSGGVPLLRAISEHSRMEEINISNNSLGPSSAMEIAYGIISRRKMLGSIDRVHSVRSSQELVRESDVLYLPEEDEEATVELVCSNNRIEKIDCSGNVFNPRAGKQILNALKKNIRIIELDLRLCNIMTYEQNQITRILGNNGERKIQKMLKEREQMKKKVNLSGGFEHPEDQEKYND